MAQSLKRYPQYFTDYERASKTRSSLPWLDQIRDDAWARFCDLGFPIARRGNEKWKYTDFRPIANRKFTYAVSSDQPDTISWNEIKMLVPNDDDWVNLVFVDGKYRSEMSNWGSPSVEVCPLSQAFEQHQDIVQQHIGQQATVSDDPLAALNTAFLEDGAFVKCASTAGEQAVVNLIFLTSGSLPDCVTHPRVLVLAESNSRAVIIENYISLSSSACFTNAVTELYVEENANVQHYRITLENAKTFHMGISRVLQRANSVFRSSSFALGASICRNDFQVLLDGDGAECNLNGLYLTVGSEHMDNFISIDHAKPNGTSRLFYKGILSDTSKAVFGGNVTVRQEAQKTDAQQTDKNLLLSDQAEIDSKPSLFIYADDVLCGHGATAGPIDEDTMFYMKSRGLDSETASRILIHAFASEIIDRVDLNPLKIFLDQLYDKAIPSATLQFGGY
ncbi:MAG: Fe-S cluster assembly protein SufD [Chloroflexota bacterium]|nr:Fe-S cluster assembly protein SufD [Chloroflexota bacterium]